MADERMKVEDYLTEINESASLIQRDTAEIKALLKQLIQETKAVQGAINRQAR